MNTQSPVVDLLDENGLSEYLLSYIHVAASANARPDIIVTLGEFALLHSGDLCEFDAHLRRGTEYYPGFSS